MRIYKLTDEIKRYRWNGAEEDYSFTDYDSINVKGYGRLEEMGLPKSRRYSIRQLAPYVPEGKKREKHLTLFFDFNGNLSDIKAEGLKDKQAWEMIQTMIEELVEKGWIE